MVVQDSSGSHVEAVVLLTWGSSAAGDKSLCRDIPLSNCLAGLHQGGTEGGAEDLAATRES